MKQLFSLLSGLVALTAVSATAQTYIFDQNALLYDTTTQRGVNFRKQVSTANGGIPVVAGSAPAIQFKGAVIYGAVPRPPTNKRANLNTGLSYIGNAVNLDLPRGTSSGVIVYVLRSAQVGAPYLSRGGVRYRFGEIIPRPVTDESGVALPADQVSTYWDPEPYSTTSHVGAAYYWSSNAAVVFATQPGPVNITWKKAAGTTATLTGNFVAIGGQNYRLTNSTYFATASPTKTPRQIYWTEGVFRATGKPVAVPATRVGGVRFAYNTTLAERVTSAYLAPGETLVTAQTNLLQELRTIWYDSQQGQIFAHNREGRIFMELLGDTTGNGLRQHLGYEIVDVSQQPLPADVTTELGEKITAYADGQSDAALNPEPVQTLGTLNLLFQHSIGSARVDYYAASTTVNQNDVLVHWLEAGEQEIRWPLIYARYKLVWPSDVAKYSHYVRPLVATEAQAKLTAVAMPTDNVPTIQYQDPLDLVRGKLTETFAYYTFLSTSQPAHRALLRFTAGDRVAFERVFSWLDVNLKTPALFANSLATNLSDWNSGSSTFTFSSSPSSQAPRIVNQTVEVGNRIEAPVDESGANLAGFILQTNGNSFHPTAYKDPFMSGFDAAQLGSIIPVNAIPGTNNLDIWWFRPSATNAVKNLVNGFKTIYWPAVIGRYTLAWPSAPSEIVMASNDGSGPLDSLQAKATIYTQNDPALPGYNPNEEHAVMIGGQAYALRDDLNLTAATTPAVLTGSGATFSSQPFVLLDYTAADGRPAIRAFKVLREKPGSGIVFDYIVQAGGNQTAGGAGSLLQAPMPLPLLPPPVAYITNGTTITRTNYNTEPAANSADLPVNWNSLSASAKASYATYAGFSYRDRKDNFWVLRGLHAGLPTLQAGAYNGTTFATALPAATAVQNLPFTNTLHVSRPASSLVMTLAPTSPVLPAGLTINGLTLTGTPTATSSSATYSFIITDIGDSASVTNTLSLQVIASGTVVAQGPLTITSANSYAGGVSTTHVGRPPFLAAPPTSANSFTMRFYYKTQAGFAWPGGTTPPAVGAIVPYLRPVGSSENPAATATPALDVVYRPVWPGDPPQLRFGETLMTPKNNLPAVRGQSSVQVLYQQSIATNIVVANASAVLHDPSREKSFALLTNSTDGLAQLPDGVRTDVYQGKTFFPNLPPHLAERFYFDPNRGTKGALVFKGEYKDEVLGEKYLLLNVLRGSDLASVKGLCPATDAKKSQWDSAVDGLTTAVETFYENPQVPGQFIVNPNLTTRSGVGTLTAVTDDDTAVDSYALSAGGPGMGYVTLIVGNGGAFTPAADPVSVYVLRVVPQLFAGELKVLTGANPLSETVSFQHTADLGGRFDEYEYEWKINPPVGGVPPVTDSSMSLYQPLTNGLDIARYTLGGSGIQGLVDNYIVLRYRPKNSAHPLKDVWSEWTAPQLAEGWIKRVLAKINPFGQRVTDLYNNTVNTDASILTSAGKRWEGDVALNMDTINNYGLIEIYETVLNRGKNLSINAGINFGPANDALLLAAGYINDLYMLVGNEAYADAANPTIGIGTKDKTYGDIATALFSFKGQVPSLLEEELGLLRGRDDFLQPGTTTSPVYNRFVWNYTRGIDAGEVIYALNYNILDQNADGAVDATDAAKLYPQGHGDAYGHYLTATKGYYSLLMNTSFDWVPRSEAVTVLGKAVQVDYLDERKFATAASAVARTGRQVFELTWRKDYQPDQNAGWEFLATNRVNTSRTVINGASTTNVVREWGADQWASRTGQGAFFNWVIGNAILPDVDPDPTHEGIQKIDRTTVPELQELATTGEDLQTALDNAEGRLTPLGLAPGSLAFDINPNQITGTDPQTHFEQVYARAKVALNNAVVSFDDAKDVTRLMRSEQDSLADFQAAVDKQELAYTNALIELYGTPYPDDIGAGKTYQQGFEGPDLLHFTYVEDVTLYETKNGLWDPNTAATFKIDIQKLPSDWGSTLGINNWNVQASDPGYTSGEHYIEYNFGRHGFSDKPANWTGKRQSPGKIQQAISKIIAAHDNLYVVITANAMSDKEDLDKAVQLFNSKGVSLGSIRAIESSARDNQQEGVTQANRAAIDSQFLQMAAGLAGDVGDTFVESLPESTIVGTAAGGDLSSSARYGFRVGFLASKHALILADAAQHAKQLTADTERQKDLLELQRQIDELGRTEELKQAVVELGAALKRVQGDFILINAALRQLDDASREYLGLVAAGDRVQSERLVFRQRAAAVIQGYRTRDAAFRIFRNEKLERYKSLFDLAARYSYLAANAYDYETGLLGTDTGKSFINRIVNARALGVVKNGEPQYAGSNTGDPGLSSTLAEMKADWDVLKGRLGFNNPDGYGTTVSLRTENLRILPGSEGNQTWQDVLQQSRMDNLLDDVDVRRYCLQIDPGTGLPVPGIVLTFSTTIAQGMNLFGQPLAAGDSAFNRSTFATKLFAAGVALEGYRGMNNPAANGTIINYANGTSPADPSLAYLDPKALAATPYVYLIPVGVDSMRSPPLGDTSIVRTWNVQDVTIPLPFNIGASDFSTKQLYQSSDSLTEPLFGLRKHQAFRPVSSATAFSPDIYGLGGSLQQSQFTNRRLIGRSVWNSKWKLVIPGDALLNDSKEGLDRFIQTVTDVKLHLITYGYSGN